MSWKTQHSLNRIFNAFKRNKKNIYTEDIEALKNVIESLEIANREFVNDNKLFAKLLSIHLRINLTFYGNMKMAIKKTNDDLKLPLNYHLEFLQMELNNKELHDYFISIGLKDWKTQTDLQDNKFFINKHQKEMIEKVKKSWSFTEVEKSFYNTVNQTIRNIENYGF